MVYASDHSTTSSNTVSPSTPSSSVSLGSSSGSTSSGSGSSSGRRISSKPSSDTSSGVVSGGSRVVTIQHRPHREEALAHCDRPGYPSCSSLGSEAGNKAAGTSCPPGHSKAFCSAYNVAAGSTVMTTKPGSSTQKGNTSASSVGNNTTSSHQADAVGWLFNQPIHLRAIV